MKRFLILSVVFFVFKMAPAKGQPVIVWDKIYGSKSDDIGQQITATADGGCAFIAWPYTGGDGDVPEARGDRDAWGCKLDANGNLVWSRVFGGSKEDLAGSVWKTDDGGVIFSYNTESTDYDLPPLIGVYDEVFHKVKANGETEWIKMFGSTAGDLGYGHEIPNGNFLMHLGFGKNDGTLADLPANVSRAVIEFDQSGNPLWKAPVTFEPGTGEGFHTLVSPTSDGGFVFGVGSDLNPDNQGETDLCIWRYSGEKKLLWKKCYGGESDDWPREILQLPDGGFVVAGQTRSKNWHITNPKGGADIWLLQLDAEGNLISERAFGGSDREVFEKMILADSGKSVIILGDTESDDGDISFTHGFYDIWLVKIDLATNKILWEKTYGSSQGELAVDMDQSEDGSLIVLGEICCSGEDGDVTGPTHSSNRDLWIFKLAPEDINPVGDCDNFSIAPNPVTRNTVDVIFSNLIDVNPEIKIFDVKGALIVHYPAAPLINSWKITLELPENLLTGIYFIQVKGCSESPQVKKFLKMK